MRRGVSDIAHNALSEIAVVTMTDDITKNSVCATIYPNDTLTLKL